MRSEALSRRSCQETCTAQLIAKKDVYLAVQKWIFRAWRSKNGFFVLGGPKLDLLTNQILKYPYVLSDNGG